MKTELEQVLREAEDHAANLQADISNAASRQEHIRLTRAAIAARSLADDIRRVLDSES